MICVFDRHTKQNEFNHNGETVLNPTSCMIHQEENGDWSLELHQPVLPDDDCWQYLKLYNIIRVSSGQLFPIYFIQKRLENNVPTLVVKAKHIFYYLNDKIVTMSLETDGIGFSLKQIIQAVFDHVEHRDEGGLTEYQFSDYSYMGGFNHYSCDGISVAKAIFEIADVWGGKLYRDNFMFSIDEIQKNAAQNSFTAEHGWNMPEIIETVDSSDQITQLKYEDNYGFVQWRGLDLSRIPPPHQVMRKITMSYDGPSNAIGDSEMYMRAHAFDIYYNTMTAYDVNLLNLSDTSRAAGWADLERCRVGDTGRVRSAILDIDNYQRVVGTDFNELTQRNERVKLANFRKSSMTPDKFASTVSGYSAETKRIAMLEKKGSFFEYVK